MIAIIDYNAGNIGSITNALGKLGAAYIVTSEPKKILQAEKVIFPGQGRAGPAMNDLRQKKLDQVLKKVTQPFLGICLGMQLLLPFSEEDNTECLGTIPGRVRHFQEKNLKVPQIGWNTINKAKNDLLFEGIPDNVFVYFVNSYYVDVQPEYILGETEYGKTKTATIIKKNNFYGTQFHPEKSGIWGIKMLNNFINL